MEHENIVNKRWQHKTSLNDVESHSISPIIISSVELCKKRNSLHLLQLDFDAIIY